jgi:hypothetical protein
LSVTSEAKISDEINSPVGDAMAAARPLAVYKVNTAILETTTARSALFIRPQHESPDEGRHYRSLRAAQRTALRLAREEAGDYEDAGIRVLFVVGEIRGASSVRVFEVEEIELEDGDGDDDEAE